MNILVLQFCLICSATGGIILPLADEVVFSAPEDAYPIQDSKFFSFLGAVLPNETSPESSLPSPADPSTDVASSSVPLIPLSETIFIPEYMIPLFAATSDLNPPTDTQLSNLEEVETDTRADPVAEYVRNYLLANLEQHDPVTEEQMLLIQLYNMDSVNKTEIKPATSVNNFHVNEQQRQQRSQYPTNSEYQQPFPNVNLSSESNATNITNETDSSIDEKYILANESGGPEESVESAETSENFGAILNDAFDAFGNAKTTVVKRFLDENGHPCLAEQLQLHSKTYFRYTCEGELYQVSTISTTWKSDVAEGEAGYALPAQEMMAAQASSSVPDHFHSFYLKRKTT